MIDSFPFLSWIILTSFLRIFSWFHSSSTWSFTFHIITSRFLFQFFKFSYFVAKLKLGLKSPLSCPYFNIFHSYHFYLFQALNPPRPTSHKNQTYIHTNNCQITISTACNAVLDCVRIPVAARNHFTPLPYKIPPLSQDTGPAAVWGKRHGGLHVPVWFLWRRPRRHWRFRFAKFPFADRTSKASDAAR